MKEPRDPIDYIPVPETAAAFEKRLEEKWFGRFSNVVSIFKNHMRRRVISDGDSMDGGEKMGKMLSFPKKAS